MKLAFQTYSGEGWLGGVNAFRDLLIALRRLGADAPSTWLVVWEGVPDDDYRAYLPLIDGKITVPYRPVPAPTRGGRARLIKKWRGRFGLHDNPAPAALAGKLRAQAVDCVFSVVLDDAQHDPTVPLIVWIYDFQYQYLPELFTPEERRSRQAAISQASALATLLLTKSDSVAADVARFLPGCADRARRLRWVADIPAAIYVQPVSQVLDTYHLPEKFFFLPNQFWMHKNHLIVFKALRRLREQGLRPVVVCSGSLVESRRPEYINELLGALSRWDLREQVIFLGVVPHDHILMLMRQSISVLNASVFEGFGMSVSECISLGKGMVLSDLPVLREQAPPASRYFDPHDETGLADTLAAVWNTTAPGPDLELETAARAALPQRQMAFGRAFLRLAEEAVALRRQPATG